MPQTFAEAKGATPTHHAGCGVERKLAREPSRGEGKDEKCDAGGGVSRNTDAKETGAGKKLSSLCRQPARSLPSEMTAFSSLPSRSADSGKLAPLDVGQRSPRSNAAPRPSLASSPREHRDYSAEGTSFSLPQSGSSSPRSMSPRLPPMKSAPSPAMMDDSSLPGLGQGLSPRKGAQSARRVRSLSPNIQRASVTDRASSGSLRPQSRGGTSGSGGGSSSSNNRISPLLEAKERECRRGDKDPMVKSSAISSTGNGSRRREGGGNGELAGGRGGGVDERLRISGDAAEAKHDATGERPTRLPGTTSTLQSRERESSNCSSSGGLLGTTFSLTPTSTNERFERRDRPSREELASTTRGDVFPDEDNHARGNRQQHRKEETKDCGSTPSIPSIGRGEDSSRSPRTRRMRPQVDSTA